ncbi:ATP-binding protein [Marinifilum sp. D714]|uniref:ATP-binding protein n=1 Tax=Marinifilum sp. D714 TaxID=2937523 RepID=UPI0027D007C7|nr:ATP-binding protein [Marinifilum sp. D714]MDQ2177313.1 ATP-binding protein [Marinifilum sp. D714]
MILPSDTKISLLKKLDFLAELDEKVFTYLSEIVETKNVPAGKSIFTIGDPGGAVYVIAEGCVQIHDEDHIFIELKEGRSFGEYALIDTDTRSASAKAKVDSVLLQCTQANLREVELKFNIKIIDTVLIPLQNIRKRMMVKDQLEEELTRQKVMIEKQRKELERLNATKDKFFSIIAHDLKNPFASLIGASDFLVNSSDELSKEQLHNFHEIINQSARRGYKLLENLLEWARMQTGNIEFKPKQVDLWNLVNEVVNLLTGSAEHKEICLSAEIDENLKAFVDENMIDTVVRNLVSNAIKFTPRGGVIKVSSQVVGQFIEITVADNGIGITPENISKLFKIDEKVSKNGTENESGTGLGLILCKEFVERHGGEIRVESELGKGSKFIFTIAV